MNATETTTLKDVQCGLARAAAALDSEPDEHKLDVSTEGGRAAIRATVGRMFKCGACSVRPVGAEQYAPKMGTPINDQTSPWGANMVQAALKSREPFGRGDLATVACVTLTAASNAMTAWRAAGWIVPEGSQYGRWVRTSGFGKAEEKSG